MPPKVRKPLDEDSSSDGSDQLDDTEYDDGEDYRPKNVLKQPRNVSYSVGSLCIWMDCHDIDLDPEYQRGFVWTEPKQMALIDSLFRNYYIPPVIFRVVEGEDGSEKRVCIDGKQRLTTIRKFMDGQLPHKDVVTGRKYWTPTAKRNLNLTRSNETRQYITEAQYSLFLKKQIVCIEYVDLSEEQEREIFHRVQMGMPLSSAERLAAIASPNSTIVRQMEKKLESWPDQVKLANDRKRRYQVVGQVVRLICGTPKITSVSANAVLEKWIRDSPPILEADVKAINEDFDILLDIAQNHASIAFDSSIANVVAPVEFIYTCWLIHRKKGELSAGQLAYAIRDMRLLVRKAHQDIRTNTKVCKSLEHIIGTEIEQNINAGAYIIDFNAISLNATSSKAGKRKRTEEDDDEYTAMDVDKTPISRRRRTQNSARAASPNAIPPTSSGGRSTVRSPVKAGSGDYQSLSQISPDMAMASSPSRPQATPAARNPIFASLGGMFSSSGLKPLSLVTPMNPSGSRQDGTQPTQGGGWGSGLSGLRDP